MKKLIKLLLLSVFLTSTLNVFTQTVYKSKSESKYHLLSCRYLEQNHDSLDLSLAIKNGFSPCGVCNPPTKIGQVIKSNAGSMSIGKTDMKPQMNSTTTVTGKQCAFVAKDGTRCTGEVEAGSKYCLEHMKKN
jgi:hypothetical protein